MDDRYTKRLVLDREILASLGKRSNGRGLVRSGLQLTLLALTGLWVVRASRGPWWELAAAVASMAWMLGTLHCLLHESTHGTAFASATLNRLGTWLGGVPILVPPAAFRAFHFEHHRHTNDPTRDPELILAPAVLTPWPSRSVDWVAMISGAGIAALKLFALPMVSLGPSDAWWSRWLPYVPHQKRRQVLWNCRAVLLIHLTLIALAIFVFPAVRWFYLALLLAHGAMNFYLAPEHTGLPTEGDVVERTRTFTTHPVMRFMLWNINFHAEHHAFPVVPFHALPRLHQLIRPQLLEVEESYWGIHRRVLVGALKGAPPPPLSTGVGR